MSLRAVRASLAAVLTTALLITLLPPTRADSGTAQTQNQSTRVRRGKNGEPVKTSGTQDSTHDEDSNPDYNRGPDPGSSKAVATDQPKEQQRAKSKAPSTQTSKQPGSDPLQGSAEPRHERDAPAFDRPPLRSQGQRTGGGRDVNTDSRPQTSSQRPNYSRNDTVRQSDSRQYPQDRGSSTSTGADQGRTNDPSTTGSVDTVRTDRSGGAPPVLRRPADSRNDGASQSSRPPVLRRPSDSQQSDQNSSPEVKAGKPYPSSPQAPQSSQQGSGSQQQQSGEDEVVKLESTLVRIPLLVSDRSGRYIPQLNANDFLLYEDGVQQKIASFGTEEVPFSVVLLLDVSPSVSGSIKDIQDAAIAFVRQLRDQDRVMVVSFDRNIHYLSDFTNDRRELEWAIRRANMGGGTSVYDAVYETVDRKLRNIEGRKALILFSDGDDTTSTRVSYDEAVNLVSESDVLVYGLRYPGNDGGGGGGRGIGWPRNQIPRLPFPFPFPWPTPRRRGPFNLTGSTPGASGSATAAAVQSWPRRRGGGGGDFMKDITAAGGGPVYDAEKISDMSNVAYRIAEELRHVYVISYYPTNPLSKGGYRKVRVSVKNRDDIAVRHRPGYNARPNGTSRPTI
jgi:Ca-activated chloride channel homolog